MVVGLAVFVYLWFPGLENDKPALERWLSRTLHSEVSIDEVNTRWVGGLAVINAYGVNAETPGSEDSSLNFDQVFISINPFYLLTGRLNLAQVTLLGVDLEVARLADGRFRIGDYHIGGKKGVMLGLIQLESVSIREGRLVWSDAYEPGRLVEMRDVEVSLQHDGERQRFSIDATMPEDLATNLRISGHYQSELLRDGLWDGELNVRLNGLNLSRIPTVIQEVLPWQSHGYMTTAFSSQWHQGTPSNVTGKIEAKDFIIPYSKTRAPLSAKKFSSELQWDYVENKWRLFFEGPEIVFEDEPISVTSFEVEGSENKRVYHAKDLDLVELLSIVDKTELQIPAQALIDELAPQAKFSQASLTLRGPYLEAKDWGFEGNFVRAGWQPTQMYPGVQGLSGYLRVNNEHGELQLDSENLQIDAHSVLSEVLMVDKLQGEIEWRRWGRDWVMDLSDGLILHQDAVVNNLSLYTRIPTDSHESPFVLTRANVDRLNLAAVPGFLPIKKMKPKQINWFTRAFKGGTLKEGTFYFNGPISDFPFSNSDGEVRASATIENGIFDYAPRWPILRDLNGTVSLSNSEFRAEAQSGALMNSRILNAEVFSADFFKRDRVLHVEGTVQAEANDVIQFLRSGPLIKNPPIESDQMIGRGSGELDLNIELPFTRLKQDTQVVGQYRFEDAWVRVREGIEFDKLVGAIDFTENTVEGEDVTGEVMGGPVEVKVSTVQPGHPLIFAVDGQGSANIETLAPFIGKGLVSRLQGITDWDGRFVSGGGKNQLKVNTNLSGVEVGFPAPLKKSAAENVDLDVQLDFGRNAQRIDIDLKNILQAELHYARQDSIQTLTQGVFNLGGKQTLPDSGVSIGINDIAFNADDWISEISHQNEIAQTIPESQRAKDRLIDHLRFLELETESFVFLNRNFESLKIEARSLDGKNWRSELNGPRLQGVGHLSFDSQPRSYDFDMEHLIWPSEPVIQNAVSDESENGEPEDFIDIVIRAQDFHYGDMQLGELYLKGAPVDKVWKTQQIQLSHPRLQISGQGQWSKDERGNHITTLNIQLDTDDLGQALTRLGYDQQVSEGKAKVSADLNWPGEPADFSFDRLNGMLALDAKKGRFLQLKPGSGKLLGLFNAETLLRRLKFDFSDVFREGLAFDRISGDAEIEAGDLSTDGILIIGSVALIDLSGRIGLAKEDYDMEVIVAPQIGGNLSLLSAIANPAAGAMVFLVQKLFKKQLAKVIHYTYEITGSWDDPVVQVQEPPTNHSQVNTETR